VSGKAKALMMIAESTPETLVNIHETTRRSIPKDCHIHIPRRENLKSHLKQNMHAA
jgi:hypothetical protein